MSYDFVFFCVGVCFAKKSKKITTTTTKEGMITIMHLTYIFFSRLHKM